MLRSKLYTGLMMLAMAAPAAMGQGGGVPFIADMPDDEAAEEIVETVKLGGEDRAPAMQEGVGEAESYEKTADPDSPVHAQTGTEQTPQDDTGLDSLKPTTAVTDPTVHDPSRVAYATNRRNARTMSLTVPGPRGIISDRNGLVMACSEVAYQPAINYGQLKDESEANILSIGRKVIEAYAAAGVKVYEKTDAQLLDHYRQRRYVFFRSRIQKRIADMEVAVTHILSVVSVQMDRERRLGSTYQRGTAQEVLDGEDF